VVPYVWGHLQIAEFPKLYAGADARGKERGSWLLKSEQFRANFDFLRFHI